MNPAYLLLSFALGLGVGVLVAWVIFRARAASPDQETALLRAERDRLAEESRRLGEEARAQSNLRAGAEERAEPVRQRPLMLDSPVGNAFSRIDTVRGDDRGCRAGTDTPGAFSTMILHRSSRFDLEGCDDSGQKEPRAEFRVQCERAFAVPGDPRQHRKIAFEERPGIHETPLFSALSRQCHIKLLQAFRYEIVVIPPACVSGDPPLHGGAFRRREIRNVIVHCQRDHRTRAGKHHLWTAPPLGLAGHPIHRGLEAPLEPLVESIRVKSPHRRGNAHGIESRRHCNRLEFGCRHPARIILPFFALVVRASNPPRFRLVSRAAQGRLFRDVLGI